MALISTSEFKRGTTVIFQGQPHQMVEVDFVNPGKGSAFFRVKLKSLRTGRVVDFTFKSGETIEDYAIRNEDMQYLYQESDAYFFMNQSTFEQVSVPRDVLGMVANFLREGETYELLVHEAEGVGIRPPKRAVVTVTEAEIAARGNTVQGVNKAVTVDTGATVQVPAFVKEGDRIAVNPETAEYIERVND
jgi:elongation factor P